MINISIRLMTIHPSHVHLKIVHLKFSSRQKKPRSPEKLTNPSHPSFPEFPRAPDRWSSVAPSLGGPPDRPNGNEAGPSSEASRPPRPETGRVHGLFALRSLPPDAPASPERGRGSRCRVATATPAATAAATVAWKAAKQHGELTNNGGDSSGPGGRCGAPPGPEQGPKDRTARVTPDTQAGSGVQEAHQAVTRITRQHCFACVHVTLWSYAMEAPPVCCPSSVRSSGREGEGRGGGREGGTFDDDQEFRCIDTLIKCTWR